MMNYFLSDSLYGTNFLQGRHITFAIKRPNKSHLKKSISSLDDSSSQKLRTGRTFQCSGLIKKARSRQQEPVPSPSSSRNPGQPHDIPEIPHKATLIWAFPGTDLSPLSLFLPGNVVQCLAHSRGSIRLVE